MHANVKSALIAAILLMPTAPAMAEGFGGPCQLQKADANGTLNPEELSMCGFIERMRADEVHPLLGAVGYGAAKSGNHEAAREIFSEVANSGNVMAMTWMAWMEDNGLAGPENAEAAAEWDRLSMEGGSAVGAFNYGLDVLRGRGVVRDEELGRKIIRRAARLGDRSAQHLIDNDFDLDSVTPDADEWKYERRLY